LTIFFTSTLEIFIMLHNFEMYFENNCLQLNDLHKTHNIGGPDQIRTDPILRREEGGTLN
jgi:hypothetical protein